MISACCLRTQLTGERTALRLPTHSGEGGRTRGVFRFRNTNRSPGTLLGPPQSGAGRRRARCTLYQRRAKRSPPEVAEEGVSIEPALPSQAAPDRGGVHGLQCGPRCIWRAWGLAAELRAIRGWLGR